MALTAIQGINQYNQQKQQYNAQSALYNAQAKAAEQNARISQVKQEQIAEQYAAQQSKLNDRMKLAAGQTAAQAGASGLQLSGSPLDALSSSYDAWRDDSSTLLQNQRNDVWSEQLSEPGQCLPDQRGELTSAEKERLMGYDSRDSRVHVRYPSDLRSRRQDQRHVQWGL